MGATNDGTKIILAGDGIGPCGARRAILAAPDESDIMYFFYRAYWEVGSGGGITSDPAAVNYGWDHTFAFGLGFDNVFPSASNAPAFARFIGVGSAYDATNVDLYWNQTDGGSDSDGDADRPFVSLSGGSCYFYKGNNDVDSSNYVSAPNFAANNSSNYTHPTYGTMNSRVFLGFPANPTLGATCVHVWKIQRNTVNPRQITVTFGVNFESLAEANFSNARTSANTVWSTGVTFDVPDNFFPRVSPMRFPTYLLMRNPDGLVGRKFIYDHGKIEFWKFTDEL